MIMRATRSKMCSSSDLLVIFMLIVVDSSFMD